MFIYIFTLFILIFPYLFKGTAVRDNSQTRVLLCFIVLFLVSGLSYNLGADTRGYTSGIGYVDQFERVHGLFTLSQSDFDNETWQPGFVYILSFFKTFTSNYLIYQLFHAFLVNFIVILFIKKQTQHVGLCLFFYCLLYYLDLNFEIQRESFAIVLGLVIYLFIDKYNNYYTKFIVVGMAILAFLLLHKSAIILILYPLLKNIQLSKRSIIVCLIITLFVQVIWIAFSDIGGLIDIIAGDTYQGYVQKEVLEANAGMGPIFYIWLSFWKVVVPYMFIYFSYKNSNPHYLIFVVLCVAFENLTYFSFAFHRFYGYFTPFYWLVLTDGVVYLSKKIKLLNLMPARITFITCMIIFITYTYHSDYFREDRHPFSDVKYVYNWYFPYESVLEPGNSYIK